VCFLGLVSRVMETGNKQVILLYTVMDEGLITMCVAVFVLL